MNDGCLNSSRDINFSNTHLLSEFNWHAMADAGKDLTQEAGVCDEYGHITKSNCAVECIVVTFQL